MSKLDLVTVTNGQNISAMNSNFQAIEDYVNDQSLSRANPTGDANQMSVDLDMNGHDILNIDSLSVNTLVVDGVDVGAEADSAAASAAAAAASATSAASSAASASATLANALVKSNNLSDVANVTTARNNLAAAGTAVSNTYGAQQNVSYTNAQLTINDTSGSGIAVLALQSNGVNQWFIRKGTSQGLNFDRYVGGTFVDTPFSITNVGGLCAFTVTPNMPTVATADNSLSGATTQYVVNKLASPTPIGSVTPNTGAFSSVTTSSGIAVDNTVASGARNITYRTSGSLRWNISADATTESGSNVGSTFNISRYNDAGTFIDTPLSIARASGTVRIRGTQTNDSAAAGDVGEYLSAAPGSTGLTSNTGLDTAVITLTPGDWDVSGSILYTASGGAVLTAWYCAINTTTNVIGADYNNLTYSAAANSTLRISSPVVRFSVASNTTVRCVAFGLFASGSVGVSGTIRARRVR